MTLKEPYFFDSNFVLYYKLNDGSKTYIKDYSPLRNVGILNGGTWLGGRLNFDGIDDYISIQDNISLQITKNISVFGWVSAPNTNNNLHWAAKFDTNNKRSWGIGTRTDNFDKMTVMLINDGAVASATNSKVYISSILSYNNSPHLLGFTFDGDDSILSLYIDGKLDKNPTKTFDANITSMFNSNAITTIGSRSANNVGSGFFNCAIYEIIISNVVFSPSEILKYYNNTKYRYL